MSQTVAKPGDYLITKNQDVFRIINMKSYPASNGVVADTRYHYPLTENEVIMYYDISSLHLIKVRYYDGSIESEVPETYKGLTYEDLVELGTIFPEESITDMFKLLYIENNLT